MILEKKKPKYMQLKFPPYLTSHSKPQHMKKYINLQDFKLHYTINKPQPLKGGKTK